MKIKIKPIIFLSIAWGISYPALAEKDLFELGAQVEFNSPLYKGTKREFKVLPVVNFDNKRVYIEGMEAGVYLYQSEKHEWRFNSEYYDIAFNPKDSSDAQIKQLDKRRATIMSGIDYLYKGKWGGINLNVSADVLNKNKGFVADVSYIALVEKNQFTVMAKAGAKWQSDRFNNYYYGVSKNESHRANIPFYESKQGINPYLELGINYQATPKWGVFILGEHAFLNKNIKNSPIISKKTDTTIKVGAKYTF